MPSARRVVPPTAVTIPLCGLRCPKSPISDVMWALAHVSSFQVYMFWAVRGHRPPAGGGHRYLVCPSRADKDSRQGYQITVNTIDAVYQTTRYENITYLHKNIYRLTAQDLCLWEPPPLDTAHSRYNVIGRPRTILISRGELLTISYFGWSTYILISDIISITTAYEG